MKRRAFITLLGGAAAWPLAARAAAGEAADYRVSGHDLSCGLGAHGLRFYDNGTIWQRAPEALRRRRR